MKKISGVNLCVSLGVYLGLGATTARAGEYQDTSADAARARVPEIVCSSADVYPQPQYRLGVYPTRRGRAGIAILDRYSYTSNQYAVVGYYEIRASGTKFPLTISDEGGDFVLEVAAEGQASLLAVNSGGNLVEVDLTCALVR